jgi:hypothetical protein
MRTLVITPCSTKQRGNVADPAHATDLADPGRRRQVQDRLAAFACPAFEMYTSTHYRLIRDGVQAVWQRWGRETVEIAILSSGYGLLQADDVIVPYDVTFDEFDEAELTRWTAHLQISQQVSILVQDYDLVFYLLGGRYLSVLNLPLDVPDSVQQIVFTAQDSLPLVPAVPNLHPFVADGGMAARRWHVKASHVRGFLFGRLCRQIVQHGSVVLEWLYHYPQDTEQLFYKRTRWRPQMALWK